MSCSICNGPFQCCYAKAKEIELFKKKVFSHFILEVIFEMLISISSVVTDILTLVIYLKKEKWVLAVFTFIPVLLPTTVFTNVYLSGGEKLGLSDHSAFVETGEGQTESEFPGESTDVSKTNTGRCKNCRICCRGFCFSIFHKDRRIRKRGFKVARKYLRRSAKYFFGTLVLRVIAWTWYLKALIFGYKALKAPKRYMKLQTPDSHWSHELLLRLDFLQAALENAPQCVIQLYALLIDSEENRTLGILTLTFSFLDFIRVATTVHWNIEKGPVQAPNNVYDSFMWRAVNMSSWILLYVARCCAIAVLVATSVDWGVVIAFGVFILHMAVFAKLFNSKKFGVAAQKIYVTAFISLFFLPELDAAAVDMLIQFYYAILLLENTCFIIPWNGLQANYCAFFPKSTLPPIPTTTSPTPGPKNYDHIFVPSEIEGTTETPEDSCFLQPEFVVLIVASFTVLGVILRLAAARRLARFQSTLAQEKHSTTMEERIAHIYSRKWTNMTFNTLLNSFLHMLRKEVLIPETNSVKTTNTNTSIQSSSSCTILISDQLATHFTASQNFIKKSFSMIIRSKDNSTILRSRRSSYSDTENTLSFQRVSHRLSSYPGSPTFQKEESNNKIDDAKPNHNPTVEVPKLFFVPALPRNSTNGSFSSFQRKFPL